MIAQAQPACSAGRASASEIAKGNLQRAQGQHVVTHACMHQVEAIRKMINADQLAVLSAGGEPTFNTINSTFNYLHSIVGLFGKGSADEAKVGEVHRLFCEKMLARRSFNAMLTLVRETCALLQRARGRVDRRTSASTDAQDEAAAAAAAAAALQPVLAWLQEHHVVEELLTVNMHQRQYVESVQVLLTTLAEVGALEKDILVNLWGKLRQVRDLAAP